MMKRTILGALIAYASISVAAAQTAPARQIPPPTSVPQARNEAPQQQAQQNAELSQIKIPKLPPFTPQEPQRIQLANGMVIFLQVDHELPLVGGTMRVRGGATSEPADKTGLISIYGDVWRTGGTKTKTGDQMDDFLEARAAKIESNDGDDSTSLSFDCLKGDFEDVFNLFLDVLHNPEFREDKIGLAKRQMYTVIARRNDDVESIVGREAIRLAYGPGNPYSRIPEYATVNRVTREDMIQWHATHVQPQNIIFGIYGDFDPKAMEARLRKAFDSWPKGKPVTEPVMTFTTALPGIYFVSKDDVNQSSIQMVSLGIKRSNPDYYAVEVMNQILGGGFASRLFETIRSKLGLAYSVGGGVGTAWDRPGISRFAMATKSATTGESVKAMKSELNRMLTDPPNAEEMRRSKDAILNSFIFNFDDKEKVLAERMRYEFYGYPPDFLERYRAGIEKVTVEDVNRVAHKYLHPDQLPTLVVGNPGELGNQLTALGPVKTLDISIPPPPGQPTKTGAAPGR
ncbi:MAG TPA: pitrilysin family protein [Terriglobales bacterium]|nr:pitrilysin family protein [Terriglobales bacterium]